MTVSRGRRSIGGLSSKLGHASSSRLSLANVKTCSHYQGEASEDTSSGLNTRVLRVGTLPSIPIDALPPALSCQLIRSRPLWQGFDLQS